LIGSEGVLFPSWNIGQGGPAVTNLNVSISERKRLSISMDRVASFVASCDQIDDIPKLIKTAEAELQKMGFEWFAFRYIPIVGATDFNKFGRLYIPRYRHEKRAQYDAFFERKVSEDEVMKRTPIEGFVLEHGYAVWFRDIIKLPRFQTPVMQEYVRVAKKDFNNAVFVPAFGRNGCRGTFLFGCTDVEEKPDPISMGMLEYIALSFLRRFHQISQKLAEDMRDRLSPREVDVLERLPFGLSSKEIAKELDISPRTVDAHLMNIYLKLEVTDRTSATVRWMYLK